MLAHQVLVLPLHDAHDRGWGWRQVASWTVSWPAVFRYVGGEEYYYFTFVFAIVFALYLDLGKALSQQQSFGQKF